LKNITYYNSIKIREMKNILIVAFLVFNNNVFTQNWYIDNNVSKVINNNVYFGKKETSVVTKYDSLTRCAIERFIVDRFNYYRKQNGAQPLVWDETLRPMTYHHVVYQRLTKTSEHSEEINVPNFVELNFADRAKSLVGYTKYNLFSEGLITMFNNIYVGPYDNPKPVTIKQIVDNFFTVGSGYNTCAAHWNQIMEPQWDRIFIYYDFNWLTDASKSNSYNKANVTVQFADAK
jgi:uncharacterized protein YkwD